MGDLSHHQGSPKGCRVLLLLFKVGAKLQKGNKSEQKKRLDGFLKGNKSVAKEKSCL